MEARIVDVVSEIQFLLGFVIFLFVFSFKILLMLSSLIIVGTE